MRALYSRHACWALVIAACAVSCRKAPNPEEAPAAPAAKASASASTSASAAASADKTDEDEDDKSKGPVSGPAAFKRGLKELVGASPKRKRATRKPVPDPYPANATTVGKAFGRKKFAAEFEAATSEAEADFRKADLALYTTWARAYDPWWTARRGLIDAAADGCAWEADGKTPCGKLVASWKRLHGDAPFRCEVRGVLADVTGKADVLLCSTGNGYALVDVPVASRAEVLGSGLAGEVSRDGFALAIGAPPLSTRAAEATMSVPGAGKKPRAAAADALPRAWKVPAEIELQRTARVTRVTAREGDAARVLERLVARGFEKTLVAELWSAGDAWLVEVGTCAGCGPGLTLVRKGSNEPDPPPSKGSSSSGGGGYAEPYEKAKKTCAAVARWDDAECLATVDHPGDFDEWVSVAGKVRQPRIAQLPEAPGYASARLWPLEDHDRFIAFRAQLAAAGGAPDFTCTVTDVEEEPTELDPRLVTIAARKGVTGMTQWKISCTGDASSTKGKIVVHAPSHRVWLDAALDARGYSVTAYHADEAGLFSGDLASWAKKGMVPLGVGTKLKVTGYGELRHVGDAWHVGFRTNCPDDGLTCAFRDGRGTPSIAIVEPNVCDFDAFKYR